MSRTRVVNGQYTKITGKDYNLFSEGNTNINAFGKNQFKADNNTRIGSEIKAVPTYQPEDSINIFVGMFFDGTGNNRYNSDKTYYSKINSGETYYRNETIPQEYTETIKKNGKEIKIKVSDRDSYWNPYSNVAKLFDLFKEVIEMDNKTELGGDYYIFKQYIEGIGTKRDNEDDILGSSVGRGNYGVISRVEEGITNMVKEQLVQNNVPKSKKINKIVFDVFGFSRGAAAARHFCNEVKKVAKYENEMKNDPYDKFPLPTGKKILSQHAGGRLGAELKKAGYLPVGETYDIEIRFLGVFDTVISDMIVKENLGYKLAPVFGLSSIFGQELLSKIKTNVSGLGIKKVFHITAFNEWRKNFALTPTEEGYTFSLLGAHSDIGGGYAHLDKYTAVLDYFDVELGDNQTMQEKEKLRQFYINQRICTEKDTQFRNTYDHVTETTIVSGSMGGTGMYSRDIKAPKDFPDKGKTVSSDPYYQIYQTKESDHYILENSRYISNKYSLVAMYIMLDKAIDNGVPFYDDYNSAPDVKMKFEYEIPNTDKYKILNEYLNQMREEAKTEGSGTYSLSYEMYNHIANNYIHLSANYGGLSAIGLKAGDHHMLESIGYVNQPVAITFDKDGLPKYNREILPSR